MATSARLVRVPTAPSPDRVAALVGPAVTRSPAYAGLAEGLRALISDGRLPVGTRLPSERQLTDRLPVSRATVTRAYDLLREQAYLESRHGSGSYARLPVSRARRTDALLMPRGSDEDSIDLTIATPPAPPGTASAYAAAVEQLPAYLPGTGYYPTGVPALREALARRFTARGLPTEPDQMVVVGGALAGVAVVAQALVSPGDRVLVESPTYPNPITTLRARRARLVGLPVDLEHGWDLDAAAAEVRRARPTAAYLIPDFHNPTGLLLDDTGRRTLAETLRRGQVTPIVDESMADLALDPGAQGGPEAVVPGPFASYAGDAFTVGSASKGFWGGLRIGWIRVPPGAADAVTRARLSLDLASPLVEQLALVELLDREDEVRSHHRESLLASRAALLAALRSRLPDWQVAPGRGGLAVWCRLPEPASSALSVAAERYGVHLAAGPSFAPSGGLEHYVRLPYTLPPERLTEAVRRIAAAWEGAREEPVPGRGRTPVVA